MIALQRHWPDKKALHRMTLSFCLDRVILTLALLSGSLAPATASVIRTWSQLQCSNERPVATDWIVLSPRRFTAKGDVAELRFDLIGALRQPWHGLIKVSSDGNSIAAFSEEVDRGESKTLLIRLYQMNGGRHEIVVAVDGPLYAGFQICASFPGNYVVTAP